MISARGVARAAVVAALVCVSMASAALATVNIETVPVGNTGNTGELSGSGAGGGGPDRICGAVDYAYNIGKYEVTAGQYTVFLNAVAGVDTYGLYDPIMWSFAYGCKIERHAGSGTSGDPYQYRVAADYANRPVNFVSWGDAARFTNWVTNGQLTAAQGPGTTETGSYALNGAMTDAALLAVTRIDEGDRVAGKEYYFIPSEDEWYKAAYYNPATSSYFDYPTSSNSVPGRDMADASGNNANYYTGSGAYPIDSGKYTTIVGEFQNSDSPYGTFDQGGNVWECIESIPALGVGYGPARGDRGGSFCRVDFLLASFRGGFTYPATGGYDLGFRVSEVPEPATMGLLAVGELLALRRRRRK